MDRTGYVRYRFRRALAEAEGYDLLAMGRPEGGSGGCYCFPNALLTECIETLERGYRLVVVDSEAGMEHIARGGTIQSPKVLLIVSDPGGAAGCGPPAASGTSRSRSASRGRGSSSSSTVTGATTLSRAISPPSSPVSRRTRA
ncbi:hypothetical protein [Methanoculleus chikugoensis]|uniref:hypothetical protein n=1 Tax=Methanoculleus chikugoensis TaxID=118126 RepID=UPI001FB294B9|nr:hypothetical protein [Methanoculleus chikugoensis]